MQREEIMSAIAVGAEKSVLVFQDYPEWVPGYVRSISLHSEGRVQVAFDVPGLDEGGAYFWASYPSLDDAIAALEVFASKPLCQWSRPHLEQRAICGVPPDHRALANAIKTDSIPFPPGAEFKLQDSYWSEFLPR